MGSSKPILPKVLKIKIVVAAAPHPATLFEEDIAFENGLGYFN